jgi:hypothetical protein
MMVYLREGWTIMNRRRGFVAVLAVVALIASLVPATAATALSAAVSADNAYADPPPYEYELLVTGYATCSQPTGQEQVYVSVWQYSPLAAGSEWATVTCTSGPVFWYAFVISGLNPWSDGEPVDGTVTLYRGSTQVASSEVHLTAQ